MATIENVNDRTILQQFHSLYERQNKTETDVQNIDAKIDQETINRQTADLSINTEIQTLKDQINSLGVLFTYKGEVATIQDLPATNNKPGDVYYVDNEQSEYVWLEKTGVYQWEEFGPAIDLSEYAKQVDLQQLKSEVDAMNTQVENNSSNIVNLTNTKQDKLTAGTNITIDENNVISASGGNKLYKHYLSFNNGAASSGLRVKCEIITNSSEAFTFATLKNYFSNSPSKEAIASGYSNVSGKIGIVDSIQYSSNDLYAVISIVNITLTDNVVSVSFSSASTSLGTLSSDKVTEL